MIRMRLKIKLKDYLFNNKKSQYGANLELWHDLYKIVDQHKEKGIKISFNWIKGHSDNVGNPEYNLKLSEKRAESVAQIFLANQFQAQNIQTIGKGSTQPIDQANTEEARAANRRVAIIIIP